MLETTPGAELLVLTDNVSVLRDLEAFAHTTGNRVLGQEPVAEGWRVRLERVPGSRLERRRAVKTTG
jgi:TusA-related sulfurtransferase